MWPFQNSVKIVGWIDRIQKVHPESEFSFRILQPGYHEHFSSAASDRKSLLTMEVWTYGSKLSELCREHLKRGDRVCVFGRLVPAKDADNASTIGIEAWSIERAEALESFRFVNHPWTYELKPNTSTATEGATNP
jgi:hypothetical protein